MLKTLDRYLFKIFIGNYGIAVIGVILLFFSQALIGELAEQRYPAYQTLYYNLLKLPWIFVQMNPPAVLLATLFTLSHLARNHELVACYSIGVGLSRIIGLLLSVVLFICSINLIFQDRVLPPFHKKRIEFYWRDMKKRPDFFLEFRKDKIWYRSKNLIYNLKTFDAPSQTIHGMVIYEFDPGFHLAQVIHAERARFHSDSHVQKWVLLNGTQTQFSPTDAFPITQTFKEISLQLSETPSDFHEIEKEVDGLRMRELYSYIQRSQKMGADTRGYEVKFHSRLSLSFIPIIMCLLAVPFVTRGKRQAGGSASGDLGRSLILCFFYWLFYSISLSLGVSGALSPWLAAWLPSFIFAVLTATLIFKRRWQN